MKKGILFGAAAYFLWGVFPIYWKSIQSVPSREIVGHRMLGSFVFVMAVLAISGNLKSFWQKIRSRKIILITILAATLLSANWLIYIWAVNAGYIVETSLGYFINPLVNVLLGVIFLREKLRPWQWISVGLAFFGILYLTWRYGALPWIALSLAFTFAFYGFIKKKSSLGALDGFGLETGLMLIPAAIYLTVLQVSGLSTLQTQPPLVILLVAFTGAATALPLLLFGAAAQRIPLSMIGFLQYMAPTLQFLIGVLLYKEPFSRASLIGFSLIWTALLIYSLEGILTRRKKTRLALAGNAA